MIEVSALLVFVAIEVILLLSLISGILIFSRLKARQNDHKAARQLVEKIKKERQARKEALRCLLKGKYKYDAEKVKQTVRDVAKAEQQLYEKIINLYLERNPQKLISLHREVEALLDHYHKLEVPVATAETDSAVDESQREYERLKKANENLKAELSILMETMGRMLNEYSDIIRDDQTESTPTVGGEATGETISGDVTPPAMGAESQVTDDTGLAADDVIDGAEQTVGVGEEQDSTETVISEETAETAVESNLENETAIDDLINAGHAVAENAEIATSEDGLSEAAIDDLINAGSTATDEAVEAAEEAASEGELSDADIDDLINAGSTATDEAVEAAEEAASEGELSDADIDDLINAGSTATDEAVEAAEEAASESELSEADIDELINAGNITAETEETAKDEPASENDLSDADIDELLKAENTVTEKPAEAANKITPEDGVSDAVNEEMPEEAADTVSQNELPEAVLEELADAVDAISDAEADSDVEVPAEAKPEKTIHNELEQAEKLGKEISGLIDQTLELDESLLIDDEGWGSPDEIDLDAIIEEKQKKQP